MADSISREFGLCVVGLTDRVGGYDYDVSCLDGRTDCKLLLFNIYAHTYNGLFMYHLISNVLS